LKTSDPGLRERVLVLCDHGRPPGDRLFLNSEFAFTYRMKDVTVALGLAQAEWHDELISMKWGIFAWYWKRLGNLQGVALNADVVGRGTSF